MMQIRKTVRPIVGIAAFLMSATVVDAQDVTYDFSTPEKALVSIQEAVRRGDTSIFVRGIYAPGAASRISGGETSDIPASEKGKVKQFLGELNVALSNLAIRQIDPLVGDKKGLMLAGQDKGMDAVRVMCAFKEHPTRFPCTPGDEHIVALNFVLRENKWLWYLNIHRPWDHWSYDCSDPKNACESVMRAISHGDTTGVFGMIEPAMLAGIDRDESVRVAREGLQDLADWKAAQDQAKRDKAESPKEVPRPFLARDPHWMNVNLEVEGITQGGIELARVWRKKRSGERVAFETFVKEGDQWRWRPKAEYTLWPVSHTATTEAPRRAMRRDTDAVTEDGKPDDEWDKYTRDFIKRYKLNDEQAQSAWRILKTCKQQRTKYLRSHQAQISKLERRSAPESVPKQREQALQELEKIKEPIQEIFEKRLKPRLDKLPTRKQRDAAEPEKTRKNEDDGG